MLKRLFDIFLAFLLMLLLSPIIILTLFLIIIFLGRPVFFKQPRPGLNEKIFTLYKFRSMTNAFDSLGNPLSDADRLTKFGSFLRKFSLDELPQLWNVLKGDMSFVGPRPLLVEYIELYNDFQRQRATVRPGITGLAQISGRNALDWEDKFKLDVWYAQNATFLLDLKILWKTAIKVIKSDGVSQEGQVTMTKFEGNKSANN